MRNVILGIFLFLAAGAANADKLKVVVTTTDLAWAAREIGGDRVDVRALLKGTENPHYVDAVPEFIRLVADAQVVCVVGLELEVGWMPKVLARSGNAQVQPGGKGYCEAGRGVSVMEKPTGAVDRSMGDIHPAGNPHFWLSPTHLGQAAGQLAQTFAAVDAVHAARYAEGAKKLVDKLSALEKKERAKLHPLTVGLKGPPIVEYHKEFSYFLSTYGLKSIGSIEEKPGVTPSAGRLAEVALNAKASGVKLILAGDTAPKKTIERFAELSGLPVVTVPLSIQPDGKARDYAALEDTIVDAIAAQLAPKGTKH